MTTYCYEAVHDKSEGGSTKRAGMGRGKYCKGLGVGGASPTCDHYLTGHISQKKFLLRPAKDGEKPDYVYVECSRLVLSPSPGILA